MRVSERNGYKPVREIIQKESMDESLKNRLWSCLFEKIFQGYSKYPGYENTFKPLIDSIWSEFIKLPLDEIPIPSKIPQAIKQYIYGQEWFVLYDLIEFIINTKQGEVHWEHGYKVYSQPDLIKSFNIILESENSAYRIINDQIIEVTSEQEIQSIEEALANTNPYSGVQQHLNQALKLISDRQNPDYRNSIKESISAVEALAMLLLEDNSITLGKAIPRLRTKYELHPTLMESLNKLYGYSSDENGVRHGSPEESSISYIDAKFMLVACTNFINYLIEKTK